VGDLPEAVRRAYEAEIERLEAKLKGASPAEAEKLKQAIGEIEGELFVEMWPIDES